MDVVEFKLKNHKKYNKKILFIFFKEDAKFTSENIDNIIKEYFKIIQENPEIHVIADSTNVNSISLKIVMSKVKKFRDNEVLLKKHVKSFAFIINNFIIRTIFDVVRETGIIKSPYIVTDNDKVALNFVIEHLN